MGAELLRVALPQVVAALAVGGAWWLLAPSGAGREVVAGQDAAFAVLASLAGAVAGAAVAVHPGPRPLLRLAVLVLGGAAAACVAAVPALLDDERGLRALGVLGLWPTAAAVASFATVLVLAGLSGRSGARRRHP